MPAPAAVHKINGEIELWRFLMALIVVIHHTKFLFGTGSSFFLKGSLAVEFFFLVSGYLMMSSISRLPKPSPAVSAGAETVSFLWRKVRAFFPEVLTAFVLLTLLTAAFHANGRWEHLPMVMRPDLLMRESMSDVFLLGMTGTFDLVGINGVTWYLSAMLLAMAVLFPVLRRWGMQPWMVVAALLILGGVFHTAHPWLRGPDVWLGCVYKGNVRALTELVLGAAAFYAAQGLSAVPWTRAGALCMTAVKLFTGLYAVLYMYGIPYIAASEVCYLLVLWVFVAAVFSRAGADNHWYDSPVCRMLGRFSLPLYLSHLYWNFICEQSLPADFPYSLRMAVYLLASTATAVAVMWGAALLRRYTPALVSLLVKPRE